MLSDMILKMVQLQYIIIMNSNTVMTYQMQKCLYHHTGLIMILMLLTNWKNSSKTILSNILFIISL